MADLLSDIRRDIDRRLDQLRPVLDEFRRLEQARDALGRPGSPARRRRADSVPRRTRMSRAESQEIDRGVLALLAADPDHKPAALATLTDTSVGSMNSRLNRLVREGKLQKRNRGNAVRYDVRRSAGDTAA